jgi:DNA-damage-inducible protein D
MVKYYEYIDSKKGAVIMTSEIEPVGVNKNFESIKKINDEDIEYWEARELMPLLGYDEWRNFKKVIIKAQESCENSRQTIKDHFVGINKMISIAVGTPKETTRKIEDYRLSRYACYLIAQNGDSSKIQIATAQTYFAVKTRMQEVSEQSSEDQKRLFARKEVKNQNKKLFFTAKQAGVNNFGKFNNYGYLGLYTLTAEGIKQKKGLGKDDILDRAGSTELAANLFRITQTDEKINNEKIGGEEEANATHFDVGRKVRKTIEEIGGTMPERLRPEKHIKEIEKVERKMLKVEGKKQLKSEK